MHVSIQSTIKRRKYVSQRFLKTITGKKNSKRYENFLVIRKHVYLCISILF